MSDTKTLDKANLAQFTGTDNWFLHNIIRKVMYTDGVKYVAENADAYWLIDEIALAQRYERAVIAEEFQFWKLAVHPDKTATLTCDDGNGNIILTKPIPFTDFPLEEISFYYTNNVILLPSEY